MSTESPEAPQVEDTPTEDIATAPEANAPDTATPDETDYFAESFDPGSLPDELRPGWKQIHGRYTQKFQELGEQRKEIEESQQLLAFLRSDDPEEQALALQALGYQIPSDTDDDEVDDLADNEIAQLTQQLQELTEWKSSLEQTEQQNQFEQALTGYMDEEIETLAKAVGRKEFTDKQVSALEAVAFANLDDEGLPDVRGAYELIFSDVLGEEKRRWMDTKTDVPAPGAGRSGTPQVDLSNTQERRGHMARIIESGRDGSA